MTEENSIIHFTDQFEKLYSIVDSLSFKLSHSKEEFTFRHNKVNHIVSKAVHPMVCFSEKNENSLSRENITYGKYGISFTKEWAITNGLKPVKYIDKKSPEALEFASLLIFRRKLKQHKITSKIRLKIMMEKCFTKNTFAYNSFLKRNFEFKSENEWRFVPTKQQIGGGYISESRNKFKSNSNFYRKQIAPFPLQFTVNDIKTIFTCNENEKAILIKKLKLNPSKIKISDWKVELR